MEHLLCAWHIISVLIISGLSITVVVKVRFVTLTGDPQGQNNINNYIKTSVSLSDIFTFATMVKKVRKTASVIG